MISGSWEKTTLICANHLPEEHPLELQVYGTKINYVCPVCKNTISANDFEKILDGLSRKCEEQYKAGNWGDIVGTKFVVRKMLKCAVIDQTPDNYFKISLENRKQEKKY